jgi:hypothetical protein
MPRSNPAQVSVMDGQPTFDVDLSNPNYIGFPMQEDRDQMLDGRELGLDGESARQMTSYLGQHPSMGGIGEPYGWVSTIGFMTTTISIQHIEAESLLPLARLWPREDPVSLIRSQATRTETYAANARNIFSPSDTEKIVAVSLPKAQSRWQDTFMWDIIDSHVIKGRVQSGGAKPWLGRERNEETQMHLDSPSSSWRGMPSNTLPLLGLPFPKR